MTYIKYNPASMMVLTHANIMDMHHSYMYDELLLVF